MESRPICGLVVDLASDGLIDFHALERRYKLKKNKTYYVDRFSPKS